MKYSINITLTTICLAAMTIFITACGSDNDSDVRKQARESIQGQQQQPAAQPPAQMPPPGQSGMGEPTLTNVYQNPETGEMTQVPVSPHHYVCPKNCEGSGGATQVSCPVCGTQYVHNPAYHNQGPTSAQGANNQGTQLTTPPNPAAQTPEPAQNAAGVWHYTCSNGCAGGAGSATACGTCGATLVHNAAYHN